MDLDLLGAGGGRLRASREPGSGPTVLLLHGLVSQRRTWEPVVRGLDGVDVVALDQRGHGESDDAPDGRYDPAACAADAAEVLHQLGGREGDGAVVVGHSWGAAVAGELAATFPELVSAVVLLDGGVVPLAAIGDRASMRAILEPPPVAPTMAEIEATLSQGPLRPWWTPETAELLLASFRVGADGVARRRLAYEHHMAIVDGMLDQDVEGVLKAIQAPTWVVVCESVPGRVADSRFADPAWAAVREAALLRAAELLAEPRILRLGGAVHDVTLQWPGLVAGLIRSVRDDAAEFRTAEVRAAGGGA